MKTSLGAPSLLRQALPQAQDGVQLLATAMPQAPVLRQSRLWRPSETSRQGNGDGFTLSLEGTEGGELIEFIELIESEDSSDRRSRRGSERPETLRSKSPQGVERPAYQRARPKALSLSEEVRVPTFSQQLSGNPYFPKCR